nr:MAG TPA: hypothetical protein [Caudoviricetes sp.]
MSFLTKKKKAQEATYKIARLAFSYLTWVLFLM